MADSDRSEFFADKIHGHQWEYASSLIDDTFMRLKAVLSGLSITFISVMRDGLVVGQRGTLDFYGDIVTVTDDPLADRIIITLPNYGTPVGLGNANAAGTSRLLAREDHVHKRTIRVKRAGLDIGTRNALNFDSSFTVTDNAGTDSVDVAGGGGGGSGTLLLLTTTLDGNPELVWDGDDNLVYAEEA